MHWTKQWECYCRKKSIEKLWNFVHHYLSIDTWKFVASWKFEKRLPKYGKSVLWMPERWRKVHEWEKGHLSTLLHNDATKGTPTSFSKRKLRRRRKICPYLGAGQMFQLWCLLFEKSLWVSFVASCYHRLDDIFTFHGGSQLNIWYSWWVVGWHFLGNTGLMKNLTETCTSQFFFSALVF